MNELMRVPGTGMEDRTPETLGSEIRNLTEAAKYMTVYYGVEIGRRLTEAKKVVPHGEWLDFLKRETEFSSSGAGRLMQLYREYGEGKSNFPTLGNISVSNALRLLAVPEEERESFAAAVDAEHISSRELEAAIKARKDAERELETVKKQLEEAEEGAALTLGEAREQRDAYIEKYKATLQENRELQSDLKLAQNDHSCAVENLEKLSGERDDFRQKLIDAEKEIKALRERPVEVAVQEPDPAEIERRVQEGVTAAMEEQAGIAEDARKEAETAKAALEKAEADLQQAKKELEAPKDSAEETALREKVAALEKQIAMSDESIVTFKLLFAQWQERYRDMLALLTSVSAENRGRCVSAVKAALGNMEGSLGA